VEIGLGPGEAVDATLKITANVVEYWYPPIGNPMPYPIAFSNQEQILTRVIKPAKKPVLSLTEVLQSLVQQLGVSFFERLVKPVLGGGAISLAIRFVMPRQFLPLLLALGGVFVLVGVILLVPELTAFGAVLIGAAIVLYVLAHRDELT
jgi:hypothetical protein